MAEKVEAFLYICGCGKREVSTVDYCDPPQGFHGTVYCIHAGGGTASVDWWAHREACIKRSVIKALDEGERKLRGEW